MSLTILKSPSREYIETKFTVRGIEFDMSQTDESQLRILVDYANTIPTEPSGKIWDISKSLVDIYRYAYELAPDANIVRGALVPRTPAHSIDELLLCKHKESPVRLLHRTSKLQEKFFISLQFKKWVPLVVVGPNHGQMVVLLGDDYYATSGPPLSNYILTKVIGARKRIAPRATYAEFLRDHPFITHDIVMREIRACKDKICSHAPPVLTSLAH